MRRYLIACCLCTLAFPTFVYAQSLDVNFVGIMSQPGDEVGASVDIDGDYFIFGAPGYDSIVGEAYIFERSSDGWAYRSRLQASNGSQGDQFGFSVAIHGEYAIVGAPYRDGASGVAYVFERGESQWIQRQMLFAPDAESDAQFGYSVAIHQDFLIIGAPGDTDTIIGDNSAGSAYIYRRSFSGGWGFDDKITAGSFAQVGERFGNAVAIHEGTAVVGASDSDAGGVLEKAGAAYVFNQNDMTGWPLSTRLLIPEEAARNRNDEFGTSVAIDGEYMAIGAELEDGPQADDQGAVFVYQLQSNGWVYTARLTADDGESGDSFGRSVSVDNNLVVVGAHKKNDGQGRVYVFQGEGSAWDEVNNLFTSQGSPGDLLGESVAVSGTAVMAGAPFFLSDGAAFVYNAALAPTITSAPKTTATLRRSYTYIVQATGVPAPTFALVEAPNSMSIDENTGQISWLPLSTTDTNVIVRATSASGFDEQAFTITVEEQQEIPNITSAPVTAATVGEQYVYDVDATGNPTPTYSLVTFPEGMVINETTGVINWVPAETGMYDVKVRANNIIFGEPDFDEQTFTITVDDPPAIISEPVLTATFGTTYSYQVVATGNPPPLFSLISSPAGMVIDDMTGLISWAVEEPGPVDVRVRATSESGFDEQSFSITVNTVPEIISSPETQAVVGFDWSYTPLATGSPLPVFTLVTNPLGMAIDASTGVITWNPTESGEFDVTIRATNEAGTDDQSFTLVVLAPPIITSTPVITATAGEPYSYDVDADGDPVPTYGLELGPAGMAIDETTGVITWTPAGVDTVLVSVLANNNVGLDEQTFSIIVSEPPPVPIAPAIISTPVTTAKVGELYTYNVDATGDPTPTYALINNPDAMVINQTTGEISWTPAIAGEVSITVQAINSAGTDEQNFSILVDEPTPILLPPTITSTPAIEATVGEAYSYTISATGNPLPTFSLEAFPEGMVVDQESGEVEWLPSEPGTFPVTVRASNSVGTDDQQFTITVSEPPPNPVAPSITSTPVTAVIAGETYSYDVNATGNPVPTYALVMRPADMTIDQATGAITWMPGEAGSVDVTVSASNTAGTDEQQFTITVSDPPPSPIAPSITSTPVTTVVVGEAYSYDVDATGNPGPTYALMDSPAGMTIDQVTGIIEWTPLGPGTVNVTVRASNVAGTDDQQFSIIAAVALGAPLITSIAPATATVGVLYMYDVEATGNPSPTYALDTSPAGMAINAATGEITWTPASPGQFDVTVVATNGVADDVSQSFAIRVAEPAFTVVRQESFADHTKETSFRLMGLPGNLDLDIAETMNGTPGDDWNAYYDNGASIDYFESYRGGSDRFRFRPGRGFWLLGKADWDVSEENVPPVPLDSLGRYILSLHAGWNIITSPFLQALPWDAVVQENGLPVTQSAYTYDGLGFNPSTRLEPYRGYYFFSEEANTLLLPHPSFQAGQKTASKAEALMPLTFLATDEEGARSQASIVRLENALEGSDVLDQRAPRDDFAPLHLGFLIEGGIAYAVDARADFGERTVFDLTLKSKHSRSVEMTVAGLEMIEGYDVLFVDSQNAMVLDLKEQPVFTVRLGEEAAAYRVIIGTQGALERERQQLVPDQLVLKPAYPNPFGRQVTIEYALPEAGLAHLRVYDILGRTVATLVSNQQSEGIHKLSWDGRDLQGRQVPVGTYFVVLQSDAGERHVRALVKVD